MDFQKCKPTDFCVDFQENCGMKTKANSLLNSLFKYNGNSKMQAKRFLRRISRKFRNENKASSLLNSLLKHNGNGKMTATRFLRRISKKILIGKKASSLLKSLLKYNGAGEALKTKRAARPKLLRGHFGLTGAAAAFGRCNAASASYLSADQIKPAHGP